jgi:hypothetical protein
VALSRDWKNFEKIPPKKKNFLKNIFLEKFGGGKKHPKVCKSLWPETCSLHVFLFVIQCGITKRCNIKRKYENTAKISKSCPAKKVFKIFEKFGSRKKHQKVCKSI